MDELLTKARSIAINSFSLALYEAQSYMPAPGGRGWYLTKLMREAPLFYRPFWKNR